MFYSIILVWDSVSCFTASTIVVFVQQKKQTWIKEADEKKMKKMQDIRVCNKETKTTAASLHCLDTVQNISPYCVSIAVHNVVLCCAKLCYVALLYVT